MVISKIVKKVTALRINGEEFGNDVISTTHYFYRLGLHHPEFGSLFSMEVHLDTDSITGSSVTFEASLIFCFEDATIKPSIEELVDLTHRGVEILNKILNEDLHSKTDIRKDLITPLSEEENLDSINFCLRSAE